MFDQIAPGTEQYRAGVAWKFSSCVGKIGYRWLQKGLDGLSPKYEVFCQSSVGLTMHQTERIDLKHRFEAVHVFEVSRP
jgi:hypothetical protein